MQLSLIEFIILINNENKIFEQNGSWEDIYKHLIHKNIGGVLVKKTF